MFLGAEVVQHLVVGETAAVVANINDDRLLVEVVRVQRADELLKALFIHARDVDVADLAAARLGDRLGVLFEPPVVQQLRHPATRGRLQFQSTRCLQISRVAGNFQQHGFVRLGVEQMADIGLLRHRRAVDRRDNVACLKRDAPLVGRSAFEHFGNLQARSAIHFVEKQAEVGSFLVGIAKEAGDAQVRGVQFAQHEADQRVEVFLHADLRHQRAILLANRRPVHTVMGRVVKAV